MAKQIKDLMDEGVPPGLIASSARLLVDRGLDPSSLPSMVVTAQGSSDRDRRLIESFLAETGVQWPTGSRMVRGELGVSYVPDPLGVDRPNYPVPWSRPTRAEVVRALSRQTEDN